MNRSTGSNDDVIILTLRLFTIKVIYYKTIFRQLYSHTRMSHVEIIIPTTIIAATMFICEEISQKLQT